MRKFWDRYTTWQEGREAWEKEVPKAAEAHPLKMLKTLPKMEGITPDTRNGLRWKAFKWMVAKDHQQKILKGFLRHPFRYGWNYLKSLMKKSSPQRDGDFFLYGLKDVDQLLEGFSDPKNILVIGFSYCHKPFECPSGRFTDACIHDPENPVCRQCFIGKAVHALPETRTIPLFIPTVHYIGSKIFEILHANPDKKILFIITACEMTLEMFGDWGNMAGICGIGVRLDGRICNTMQAFDLSERGIKPGLTVVLDNTQERLLEIIRSLRNSAEKGPKGPKGQS